MGESVDAGRHGIRWPERMIAPDTGSRNGRYGSGYLSRARSWRESCDAMITGASGWADAAEAWRRA
jgi:hypothetical protein